MPAPVAILFARLGPYHVARIAAAAARYPTVAVEFARDSADYAWDRVESESVERFTIVTEGRATDLPRWEFARRLFQTLDRVRPRAIAIPGWYHVGSFVALAWARRTGTPVVIMSETQESDEERGWLKEHLKSRLVGLCSAALVGGQRHGEYIRTLGMAREQVFYGYDAVDNAYFSENADRVRKESALHRARLNLPEHFFIASNRFIAKKNLPLLLRAYARYRQQLGADAFQLVVLGDGPMRNELDQLRRSLRLEGAVHFPGFQQYPEIPTYYALAEAFVHASTVEQWGLVVNEAMAAGLPVIVSNRCGCVPELVREGQNGFSFDPHDEVGLSDQLALMTRAKDARLAMGQRSRELVSRLSPAVFAEELGRAVDTASSRRREPVGAADWALLAALVLRPAPRRAPI